MKIAITSDWHGRKPDSTTRDMIDSCEMLLLCGDIFEPFNSNDKLENYFKSFRKTGKPVVMTPGNHDFGIFFGEYPDLSINYGFRVMGCKRFPVQYLKDELGIDCLIDKTIEKNGIKIHGTPWTPMFCNWAFMLMDNEELAGKYDKIPENIDILISHGPPYDENSKIDSCCERVYDGQPDHLGSKMLYKAIIEKNPKWCFCGHIHSGGHDEITIGNTRCANVSLLNEQYERHYPVKIIEV